MKAPTTLKKVSRSLGSVLTRAKRSGLAIVSPKSLPPDHFVFSNDPPKQCESTEESLDEVLKALSSQTVAESEEHASREAEKTDEDCLALLSSTSSSPTNEDVGKMVDQELSKVRYEVESRQPTERSPESANEPQESDREGNTTVCSTTPHTDALTVAQTRGRKEVEESREKSTDSPVSKRQQVINMNGSVDSELPCGEALSTKSGNLSVFSIGSDGDSPDIMLPPRRAALKATFSSTPSSRDADESIVSNKERDVNETDVGTSDEHPTLSPASSTASGVAQLIMQALLVSKSGSTAAKSPTGSVGSGKADEHKEQVGQSTVTPIVDRTTVSRMKNKNDQGTAISLTEKQNQGEVRKVEEDEAPNENFVEELREEDDDSTASGEEIGPQEAKPEMEEKGAAKVSFGEKTTVSLSAEFISEEEEEVVPDMTQPQFSVDPEELLLPSPHLGRSMKTPPRSTPRLKSARTTNRSKPTGLKIPFFGRFQEIVDKLCSPTDNHNKISVEEAVYSASGESFYDFVKPERKHKQTLTSGSADHTLSTKDETFSVDTDPLEPETATASTLSGEESVLDASDDSTSQAKDYKREKPDLSIVTKQDTFDEIADAALFVKDMVAKNDSYNTAECEEIEKALALLKAKAKELGLEESDFLAAVESPDSVDEPSSSP